MKQNGDGNNVWLTVGRYFGLVSALPAAIFMGYEIGAWLDMHYSTTYLTIVFVILGTAAGILPMVYDVIRDERKP